MNSLFSHINSFSSDLYIVDYTEYSKTHNTPFMGVTISDVKPDLIEAFYLKNKHGVFFDAINFEENKAALRNKDGKVVKQCECMCVSSRAKNKGWLFLLELKYCLKKNVAINTNNALKQLEDTHLFFKDEMKIIDSGRYRIYWIISIPDHSNIAPFDAFVMNQDQKIEYKKKWGVIIIGENEVEILNEGYLRGAKR